jgi:hypothetical protein
LSGCIPKPPGLTVVYGGLATAARWRERGRRN